MISASCIKSIHDIKVIQTIYDFLYMTASSCKENIHDKDVMQNNSSILNMKASSIKRTYLKDTSYIKFFEFYILFDHKNQDNSGAAQQGSSKKYHI